MLVSLAIQSIKWKSSREFGESSSRRDTPRIGKGKNKTTQNQKRTEPTRKALLVGMAHHNHRDKTMRLYWTSIELELVEQILISEYAVEDVVVLCDQLYEEDLCQYPSTKDNITKVVNTWVNTAIKGDELFLYLSGHGGQREDDRPAIWSSDWEPMTGKYLETPKLMNTTINSNLL